MQANSYNSYTHTYRIAHTYTHNTHIRTYTHTYLRTHAHIHTYTHTSHKQSTIVLIIVEIGGNRKIRALKINLYLKKPAGMHW